MRADRHPVSACHALYPHFLLSLSAQPGRCSSVPRIIHRALLERLLRLPEVGRFLKDFRTLTGLQLHLLDEFGTPVSAEDARPPLCMAMQSDAAGRRLCQRAWTKLLRRDTDQPTACACDAGLNEVSVPLQVGGQTVGFLVFAGFRHGPIDGPPLRRARHLVDRAGVASIAKRHRRLLAASPALDPASAEALSRIVAAMGRHLAHLAVPQLMNESRPLSAVAHRARRHLRAHGLSGRCDLADVSRACGVSPAHLSRVFHQSTGLTISEYLARFRVEHATELLRRRRGTVAEIAFASGFQSVSQFNRTFKRIAGCAPTQLDRPAAELSTKTRPASPAPCRGG